MKSIKKQILFLLLLFLLFTIGVNGQSLENRVDAILEAVYAPDTPGVTALIAKNGNVLYRKAFGKSNLELDIDMIPENVFEIGSITKQFTAVAILMLEEQGNLNTSDKLSKYISDYPKGDQVTIHHLLNHTSGIKSYTSMPDFRTQARTDMEPITLINFFKNEPYDFEPGTEYKYNNSAYIVLGYIIEEVSGMPYADFIEQKIFTPLGMETATYGSHSKLIKNRASGYQPLQGGYKNADYLSMTLPYAAGSLMASVDDMLVWQQAIHNNTLITKESKQKAFTSGILINGKPIHYGYGWRIDEIQGVPTIEHGGGIFGYTTYGLYIPSEDIYAVVLHNANGRTSPTDVTIKIAAEALNKSYINPQKVTLSDAQLKKWTGTYTFEDDAVRHVTYENGHLYSKREGSEKFKIFPISDNEFGFENSFSRYTFAKAKGKRTATFSSRIQKSKGVESDAKAPKAKVAIEVAPDILRQYEGVYELQPGFAVTISVKEDKIYAMATGQPEFEIFPEVEDTFFLKVVPAKLVFGRTDNGAVIEVTLHQGGQQLKGIKK